MAFGQTLIINLAILGAIVLGDWGHKSVSWERLLRPLIVCAIVVPLFVHSVPSNGNDVWIQVLGILAGVAVGLLAVSVARVDHQTPNDQPATTTGWVYALIWIAISVARIVFAYGAAHWFRHALLTYSLQHRLTAQGITNALVFMAVAAALTRVLAIAARVGRDRRRGHGRPMFALARTAKRALTASEIA